MCKSDRRHRYLSWTVARNRQSRLHSFKLPGMKPLRVFLFGALCAMSITAFAQWQWLDADGRKVFSDRPPPPEVPAKNILKQPGERNLSIETPAAQADAPPVAASAAASAPRLAGKDPKLEARKKEAEEAEAAKKKAEEEKFARDKAQNCERARRAMATLSSGVRIQQTNAKGEREYMDDAGRSAETKRIQGVMDSNCK